MTKQADLKQYLQLINQLTVGERVTKKHPGNIHLWWNRSPIESSEKLLQCIFKRNSNKKRNTKRATIVDPFSGSGCLTLAAMSSGLPVMAGDLNPVATVITKAVAEIPFRFKDKGPVSPRIGRLFHTGAEGIAADIHYYGERIINQLESRLGRYYPDVTDSDGKSRPVYAWIWTRTAPCPNPACNCTMPLATSYVLSRQKGHEYHAVPKMVSKRLVFEVLPGAPVSALNGNKIGKNGAQFQCPNCGTITKDSYIKSMGTAGKLGTCLMAVSYDSDGGRFCTAPDEKQFEAIEQVRNIPLPVGDMPNNTRWFGAPLFGLKAYADLYTPRQMLLMTTLCDLVDEAQKDCRVDAALAGLTDDGLPLESGSSGDWAYSQAIAIYLALFIGKLANFQSQMCTWDNRSGNMRAAFNRQALPITWTFAEGNPFSSITGNLRTMLLDVVTAVDNLPVCSSTKVINCDALRFPFPKNAVLFTELPYYDHVGYTDLSGYFYIWLRKCLKEIMPDMFYQELPKMYELTSVPEHYGGDAQLANKEYEEGIRQFFRHFCRFASEDYPSLVFYEFSKEDEASMASYTVNDNALSHWESLIDALIKAEFQINATLPIRTHLPDETDENLRIAVIFSPRDENTLQTSRRLAVTEIKRMLPQMLEECFTADIDERDRRIVGMGCGLSLFTGYASVMNSDGSKMNVQDALRIIWAEVTQTINNTTTKTDLSESGEE